MKTIPITDKRDSSLVELIQKVGKPYVQNQNPSAEEIKAAENSAKLMGMKFSSAEILTEECLPELMARNF